MSIFKFSGLPQDWKPVTPNDSTDNVKDDDTQTTIAIRAATIGDVVVTTAAGTDRTLAMAAGEVRPLWGFTRVKSTGTTATGLEVGLVE